MKKRVITYGTYDLLHKGHINILKNASRLGDELYVAVSSDEFNKLKGKESFQSFDARSSEIEKLPFVTKVIKEDSWDQKETDIINNNIDVLVMGSDWEGKFDYLKEKGLCDIHIFNRTKGISSTDLRNKIIEIAMVTYKPNLVFLQQAFNSLKPLINKNNFIIKIYDNGNKKDDVKNFFNTNFTNVKNFEYHKINKNNGKGPIIKNILTNTDSDYVQVMNDDDVLDSQSFILNINNILGKEFDIAYMNYFYLNNRNNKSSIKKIIKGNSRILNSLPKRAWTIDLNAIYNIKFIKNNIVFSNDIHLYSDVYFNSVINSKAKNFFYLNNQHYFYRIKQSDKKNMSSSRSIKNNIEEFKKVLIEISKIDNMSINTKWRFELMFLATILLTSNKLKYKNLLNEIKKVNLDSYKIIKKSKINNCILWKGWNVFIYLYKLLN